MNVIFLVIDEDREKTDWKEGPHIGGTKVVRDFFMAHPLQVVFAMENNEGEEVAEWLDRFRDAENYDEVEDLVDEIIKEGKVKGFLLSVLMLAWPKINSEFGDYTTCSLGKRFYFMAETGDEDRCVRAMMNQLAKDGVLQVDMNTNPKVSRN